MLLSVVSAFEDEIKEIVRVFDAGPFAPLVPCSTMPYHPTDDGCLVSVWDAWNRFMRSLYLTCASGTVTSTANTTYTPIAGRNEGQAVAALRQASTPRGSGITVVAGEPKWFVVSSVGPICNALGLRNSAQIQGALSQTSVGLGSRFTVLNPIEDIRVHRNYVAHKTMPAVLGLQRRMTAGIVDFSAHLRERTRGGSSRFHDWCDGLVTLAWDASG
jgi:hypothetical protein